ncbi:hypothetical protein TWF481_007107 [Arthrobotrys musiformis]|uniref:FHA domain-containing protein n=1 Tax=Arthrobotrys musiformis TaxID=47236 RepID=A0AAV9WAG4_9PEZI
MGRWDSPSPTRARSRSPRDSKRDDKQDDKRDDRRDNRRDDRRHDRRDGRRDDRRDDRKDRDAQRKRSRWEDEDDGKSGSRRDRDRDEKGRDRDRERRRRDDDSSRRDRDRDRDRGGREKEKEKEKDRRRPTSKSPPQEEEPEAPPKEAPNFNRTTHLVSETNTLNGVVLKYVEPAESRLPPSSITYRLYVFKSSEILETITLSTRTAWLFGRDRLVADIPLDHPSASKQHAVIQFRFISKVNEYGERKGEVKPYVIDLGSANGTMVNGDAVPEKRYFELKEKDVVTFGHSSREYVLMVEK